jgi:hypothetical protein
MCYANLYSKITCGSSQNQRTKVAPYKFNRHVHTKSIKKIINISPCVWSARYCYTTLHEMHAFSPADQTTEDTSRAANWHVTTNCLPFAMVAPSSKLVSSTSLHSKLDVVRHDMGLLVPHRVRGKLQTCWCIGKKWTHKLAEFASSFVRCQKLMVIVYLKCQVKIKCSWSYWTNGVIRILRNNLRI